MDGCDPMLGSFETSVIRGIGLDDFDANNEGKLFQTGQAGSTTTTTSSTTTTTVAALDWSRHRRIGPGCRIRTDGSLQCGSDYPCSKQCETVNLLHSNPL